MTSCRPPKFAVLECNKRRSKRRVCAYGVCSKEQRIYLSQWSRFPSIDLNLRFFWKALFFCFRSDGWNTSHPLYKTIFKITFTETSVHKSFANLKGKPKLGGGFKYIVHVILTPIWDYLGKWSNLTHICSIGLKPPTRKPFYSHGAFSTSPQKLSPNGWWVYIPVTWGLESRCLPGRGLLSMWRC